MNKHKFININKVKARNIIKFAIYATTITACLGTLEALAFDLDKAGKGMLDPTMTAINNNYGKGIIAGGALGMLVAQGDMRIRAVGFFTGAVAAGLVMLGVKAGYGI